MDFKKMLKDLADNVNAGIANAGYCNAAEFARATNQSETTVRRILAQEVHPSLEVVANLAQALNIPLVDLLGDEARKF